MIKKIFSLVLAVVLYLSVLTANAWAIGDFSATCSNVKLISGTILSATCKTASGAPNQTTINLNNLISNLNGSLSWDGSNFAATSKNIALVGSTELTAQSEKSDGRTYVPTSINLDEHIANINGVLTWQEQAIPINPIKPAEPTTGQSQVPTNSITGIEFTNKLRKDSSYKFTPAGTWKPKSEFPDFTAAGLNGFAPEIQTPLIEAFKPFQENLKYPNNTTFALLAVNKTTGKVIEVDKETTIVLKPGETLTFLVNDFTPNYGDNTGTLTVNWSAS